MKCEEKKTREIFSLSVSFLYLYAKPHNLGILIKKLLSNCSTGNRAEDFNKRDQPCESVMAFRSALLKGVCIQRECLLLHWMMRFLVVYKQSAP